MAAHRWNQRVPRTATAWCCLISLLLVARADSADDMIDRVSRATAFVKRTPAGEGSAFCIDPAGLFITNLHVVDGLDLLATVPLVVDSGTPQERTVLAQNLSSSNEWDLALLKVETDAPLPFLPLLPADEEPALGNEVRAFGFPFGTLVDGRNPSITMNQGRVSSLGRDEQQTLETVRFDAVINFGNSGGPLVDASGRVIGVVTAKMAPPADRTSFAVSIPRLREFLEQPGLGIHVEPIPWEQRGDPADFHIGLITDFGSEQFQPRKPNRIELELSADSGQNWQTLTTDITADTKEVTISAVPDPREELKLLIRRGRGPQLKPGELVPITDRVIVKKVNGKLSDAARLIRIPDDKVQIELRRGGAPRLPAAELIDGEQYLPEGTWNTSIVHIDDPHVGFIRSRIRACDEDVVLRTVELTFPLTERPLYAGFPGDPLRLDRDGPVKELGIQLGFQGQITFALGVMGQVAADPAADSSEEATSQQPQLRDITGLLLRYPGGQPSPGDHSLAGPFVRLNGRMWHYATPATNEHPPNLLPMELAPGAWECEVVRDFSAARQDNELQEGEVQIERADEGLAVTISTPAAKQASYRITFHPQTPDVPRP